MNLIFQIWLILAMAFSGPGADAPAHPGSQYAPEYHLTPPQDIVDIERNGGDTGVRFGKS